GTVVPSRLRHPLHRRGGRGLGLLSLGPEPLRCLGSTLKAALVRRRVQREDRTDCSVSHNAAPFSLPTPFQILLSPSPITAAGRHLHTLQFQAFNAQRTFTLEAPIRRL